MFNFIRNCQFFFSNLHSHQQGINYLTYSTTVGIIIICNFSHSCGHMMICFSVLICITLILIRHLCTFDHFKSFVKCLFKSFVYFLFKLSHYWVVSILDTIWTKSFVRSMQCKYLFQLSGLPFHFLDSMKYYFFPFWRNLFFFFFFFCFLDLYLQHVEVPRLV